VLQALCEKGLVAMENSHRRIIAELEEKHRQEIEQLRHEKEQALAEETQATLAGTEKKAGKEVKYEITNSTWQTCFSIFEIFEQSLGY
jgi:hypothetical protein